MIVEVVKALRELNAKLDARRPVQQSLLAKIEARVAIREFVASLRRDKAGRLYVPKPVPSVRPVSSTAAGRKLIAESKRVAEMLREGRRR